LGLLKQKIQLQLQGTVPWVLYNSSHEHRNKIKQEAIKKLGIFGTITLAHKTAELHIHSLIPSKCGHKIKAANKSSKASNFVPHRQQVTNPQFQYTVNC
jgi:hypothetical protein